MQGIFLVILFVCFFRKYCKPLMMYDREAVRLTAEKTVSLMSCLSVDAMIVV